MCKLIIKLHKNIINILYLDSAKPQRVFSDLDPICEVTEMPNIFSPKERHITRCTQATHCITNKNTNHIIYLVLMRPLKNVDLTHRRPKRTESWHEWWSSSLVTCGNETHGKMAECNVMDNAKKKVCFLPSPDFTFSNSFSLGTSAWGSTLGFPGPNSMVSSIWFGFGRVGRGGALRGATVCGGFKPSTLDSHELRQC